MAAGGDPGRGNRCDVGLRRLANQPTKVGFAIVEAV